MIRTLTIDLDERERKEAAASRRFPCTVSSDTPVTRRMWDGAWAEVLSHTRGAVDLSRAPLPVLEGHDRTRVNVGIVSGLKLDGPRLRGELVLGASARAKELAEDIAAGIVTGLSVGYTVDREERDEKAKRITATRWTPYEVSIVSIPADVTVGINRSAGDPARRNRMDPQDTTHPPAPVADPTRAAAPATPAPEVLAERARVTEIQTMARQHDLGDAFAQELIQRGVPLERARALVLDRLAQRDEETSIVSHIDGTDLLGRGRSPVAPGDDLAQDFQRAAVDALLLRAGIRVEKPHAAARDVDPSIYAIARMCLSRAGKSASRWRGGEARGPELLRRAAGTSDFASVLEGALHASIRRGWEDEPASHRAWVRVVPFVDFREAKRPILSSAPNLAKVTEHGEYTAGYFRDEGTGYKVEKYGKIIALSFEALVNDNLGAFLRVQPALGQAARRLEADLVYALFALNSGEGPAMPDGSNLFVSGHANVTSAGTFDADLLSAGRALMRKQKALGGTDAGGANAATSYLSLVPRYWLVDPDHETDAEVILANASRRMATEKTTAEWIASLELVVEPRLANTASYLAADGAQIDTIELGLLEENIGGPHIETEQGFDTDESRWKVRHTGGVKALDHRGLVRMPISG